MGTSHEYLSLSGLRFFCWFLQMSAELVTHGGQEFICKVGFAAGAETLVKRRGENRCRHRFVDCGFDRPASFARVRHSSGKFRESRVLNQGARRKIQEPRCDYTAAPPYLGDVLQIKFVLVMLRIPQGGCFGVDLAALALSDVGGAQHGQSFRIGCHDSVLDAIVDHLYEMAGTVGTAVQVALFGAAIEIFATRRARYV